jgi:hypothetical protein
MARAGTWNSTCSQTSLQRAFPDARTAFVGLVRVSVFSFSLLSKALQVVVSIIWTKNSLFDNCWVLWLWSDRSKAISISCCAARKYPSKWVDQEINVSMTLLSLNFAQKIPYMPQSEASSLD